MKTILEIDFKSYVLPDDVNLNTLLKVLGKSKKLDRRFSEKDTYVIEGEPRIEVKIVDDKDVVDPKDRKRLAEKASEDCHGPGV